MQKTRDIVGRLSSGDASCFVQFSVLKSVTTQVRCALYLQPLSERSPCHRDIMPCRYHVTPLLLLLSPCCSSRLVRRSSAFRVGRVLRLTCLRGGTIDADNFYEVLGVKSDAASSEIKRAYRQRSLETHPDRNKDPNAHEQFIQVGRAYETLKDPAKRASYDQTRRWRTQQREQHAEKHTDEGQYERWRPPPRSQPDEPYNMDDALKTFRSFFGHAVEVLGESQLDRLLEADSPFASVARSTWIATSLAYVLRPNATAEQRAETRRAIDAGLTFCMPLLSGTIGRRNAARFLGFFALALTPLALSRYAVGAMPMVARRAIVGLATCAAWWRVCRLSTDERKALVGGCSRAADVSINLVARIVGGRERSKRWLVGLALVLMPLLLARAVGAVWSVLGVARLAARLLPGIVTTWGLGMLVAAIFWLAWEVGARATVAQPNTTEPEEETKSGESGED